MFVLRTLSLGNNHCIREADFIVAAFDSYGHYFPNGLACRPYCSAIICAALEISSIAGGRTKMLHVILHGVCFACVSGVDYQCINLH